VWWRTFRGRSGPRSVRAVLLSPLSKGIWGSLCCDGGCTDRGFSAARRPGADRYVHCGVGGIPASLPHDVLQPLRLPVPHPEPDATSFEIPAGLFDDDLGLRPDKHIFVELKAPWCEITDGLPQLDKQRLYELRRGRGTR
jgi:hypothetical protein